MHENINNSNVKIKFYHFTRFSDCTQQWGIKCLIVIMLLLKRFIHTQTYKYIYKWCSLNLFKSIFEYLFLQKKKEKYAKLCTNWRH